MTMNLYLMGKSTVTSNKPLLNFTGTDENSVKAYPKAVRANLFLNIGPETMNKLLHQNWVRRRTALIQTTLDEQLKKCFLSCP